MELNSELLQTVSKRAWRLSWIFILTALISLFVSIFLILNKKLYIIDNFIKLEPNYLELLKFFSESFSVSLLIFGLLYILKGDSDNSIKKSRERLYKKIKERVDLVFKYRYDFPIDNYNEEIRNLTQYTKVYKKDDLTHEIKIENITSYFVDGVDSLYINYNINEKEKVLFSIWHSGTFIAMAIAIKKDLIDLNEKDISQEFENSLNLSGSIQENNRLSIRDGYWWFDVKYDTSDEFLFNNIEKEHISRKVAHMVTVGLNTSMRLLKWKEKK